MTPGPEPDPSVAVQEAGWNRLGRHERLNGVRPRLGLTIAVLVAACGGSAGTPSSQMPAGSATSLEGSTTTSSSAAVQAPSTGREVSPIAANTTSSPASRPNLTLYVSNQSFEDDPVKVTVDIDGEVVVNDVFNVESQHNWITYELYLAPGRHEITMTSDTGVRKTTTLRMPRRSHRWAVIDYWYYPPDGTDGGTPRSFSFRVDDKRMSFD